MTGALLAVLMLVGVKGCGGGPPLGGNLIGGQASVDIGAPKLTQPPRPPEILAHDARDLEGAARGAAVDRLARMAARNGATRYESAQIPFFFESEIGRAYLESGPGRALARGAPAERCAGFGVALNRPSPVEAAREALASCLQTPPAYAEQTSSEAPCACQLIAAENLLLTEAESFAYPRAVNALLIDPARDVTASLIAEERTPTKETPPQRLAALSQGARSLWLLAPTGPMGALDLSADGLAEFRLLKGPAESLETVRLYTGAWRAEGYRRGRLAKRMALTDSEGGQLLLLIGYDPEELRDRRQALTTAARELFSARAELSRGASTAN
ncbi:MAG: hypothetical protein KTR21_04865 [Rhodobacteraceae bacterium]|nr:hypothetical protein [Paracoccaceae bacterium]